VTTAAVAFRVHAIDEHVIRSDIVAQSFRIKVQRPCSRADDTERFPVLYATDGDELFAALAALSSILQAHGEVPRFILVGIGYENARAAGLLRTRDYYTHGMRAVLQEEIQQLARSPRVSGVADLDAIIGSTDAAEFLEFITAELIPFIDGRYPTLPDDINYFGFSAGATFGLRTLFTRPATFRRYVLASPVVICKDRGFALEWAEAFIGSGRGLRAKVFLSVGELEEFRLGQFHFVSGHYALAKLLRRAAIPGLELTLRLFAGETHATAWAPAFSHGMRALFGPADGVPFVPEYLRAER
jgi:uncharacterized protein